jgi:hypothetical protein
LEIFFYYRIIYSKSTDAKNVRKMIKNALTVNDTAVGIWTALQAVISYIRGFLSGLLQ